MKTKTQSGIALATTLIVMFLVVALVIGFSWMVLMDQRLGGVNGAEQYTFYGAEAGLEKLTGDLATLFANNSSPSGAQVNAISVVANAPIIQGIQYLNPNGSLGYQITFPQDDNGNPLATNHLIQSGNYQGMTGLLTPYTLTVTSTNPVSHSEVRLTRNVQTVAIPVFQFGMFSQTDLSFFAGPDFDFGGNVMTNGNLFLASGADLVFNGKVLSAQDIIVKDLSNGNPTSNGYTGSVYIPTTTGGCPSGSYPSGNTAGCVALTQGSLVGTIGSAQNSTFKNTIAPSYNGYVGSSETNVKPVNLSITLNAGANPIDLIRRPVAGENSSNPGLYSQRYYSQASMRILLSDNIEDIENLPCIDTSVLPTALVAGESFGGVPIAASDAVSNVVVHGTNQPSTSYASTINGYWQEQNTPLITGYIKIEIQNGNSYPTVAGACGAWKDVTGPVLTLGIAGRNLNPNKTDTVGPTSLPALFPPPGGTTTTALNPSTCPDPSGSAIIRLERLRDNPSNAANSNSYCGALSSSPYDYWPNALFDTREGNLRDLEPPSTPTVSLTENGVTTKYAYYQMPTLGGVMDYTELDISNLVKFLTTNATGEMAKDGTNSTNDFTIYFSDRRGNYTPSPITGWPPASPSGHETGEYGFEDSINPSSPYGCPNNTLDQGEQLDTVENSANQTPGASAPEDYGETSPSWPAVNGNPVLFSDLVSSGGLTKEPSPTCTGPTMPWPGAYVVNAQEARQNPTLFFRRALKIVNGSSINLGTCPDGEPCGLTIVSENPVYVQGDFNAPEGSNGNASATHVATSIIADAVTLLSDDWNDVNSFIFPYYSGSCPSTNPPQGGNWGTCGRNAVTTNYRFAVVAGKGISFPEPSTCGTGSCYTDFGTDGGVHNFIRMLENWGGQWLYYRGSVVSFYYNRQATGVYKDGLNNTVYSPPTRGYQFDSDFLTPSLLPPRTPMFRDVNTVGFTQVVLPTP